MSKLHETTSLEGPSSDTSKEWSNVEDSEERRRIQNRLAQRKYRARVRGSSNRGKQHDIDLAVVLPNMFGAFEHGHSFPNSSSSMLDHEASTAAPWLQERSSPQPTPSLSNLPSSYDTSHPGVVREHASAFTQSSSPFEYANMQVPYPDSLRIPTKEMGVTDRLKVNKFPTVSPTARLAGHQTETPNLEYFDRPREATVIPPQRRRSRLQLPQRERGFHGSGVPEPKDPAQKQSSEGVNGRARSKSRQSKSTSRTNEFCNELTKHYEEAQKKLMQQAYQRGRAEAVASFEKQRSHLQQKAQKLMDGVIETWSLGVNLEVFGQDEGFERLLRWVRKGLNELTYVRQYVSVDNEMEISDLESSGSDDCYDRIIESSNGS